MADLQTYTEKGKRRKLSEEERNNIIEITKEYIEKGYTIIEIAEVIGYDYKALRRLIQKYASTHSWYTEEEIYSFRRERKIKKYNETNAIEKIKKYIEQGYTYGEIEAILGINPSNMYMLIKEYSSNNPWYSIDDFNRFKKERKKRNEKDYTEEERARQEKESIKSEEERKKDIKEWIKKRKELEKRLIERSKQERIEGKIDNGIMYNKSEATDNISIIYRKKVESAYEEYISGDEEMKKIFKDYLNILLNMNAKKDDITKDDIRLSAKILADCPSMLNNQNLRFILLQYNKHFGEYLTIRLINNICDNLEESTWINKLEKAKNVIHELNLKNKIIKMYSEGIDASDIAKELHITYHYVVQLYKKDIKFDYEQR